MKHRDIIQSLEKLDLKDSSIDIVKEHLRQFGKFGVMLTTFHQGKRIIRARLSEKESFKSIPELSYKPQEFNTTYQRASTPFRTMFYGSVVPEVLGKTEPDTARITAVFEISDFVKDKYTKGELDITFSVWEVVDNIELVSLIHHKKFERPTKLSIDLLSQYDELINSNPDLKIPSKEISEYLGYQFAKEPILQDRDYKISAAYSEIVSENFDGVLYPSVQLAGEGINVAIKPETVNSKLVFLGAAECTIYKNGKNTFVGNNTQSTIGSDGILKFNTLEKEYFVSKEFGRKYVGLI